MKGRSLDTSLDLSRLPDVQRWGDSAVAYLLTLSRQLEAFRAPDLRGYLAYAVVENTAVMVGDPVSDQCEALLSAFVEWCRSHALHLCGIEIRKRTAISLRSLGLAINKLGVENYVDLKAFNPEMPGREYRRTRQFFNTAKRYGVVLVERPIDLVNPKDVLDLSSRWRSTKKNQGELRLLLREVTMVPEPGVRYCFCRVGPRLLGFVFFMPLYRESRVIGYCAGIERYALDEVPIPGGFNAMKYIAYEFARTAKQEGAEVLALGMSPLYGLDDSEFNDSPELTRLFKRIYDESELYAFKGIATHKRQYPCRFEEPVFIATEPDATSEGVLNVFKGVGLLDV